MVDHKKNHVVPVSILKNFRSDDKKFFYFNLDKPDAPVKHRNPKSVFWRKDFYVAENAEGIRDTSLESKVFCSLETNSKIVFDKILSKVRNDEIPKLTNDEMEITHDFLASQFVRSPDFLRTLKLENEGIFKNTMNKLEWTYGPFWKFLAEKSKNRILQTAKCDVLSTSKNLPNLNNAIKSKGIYIARIDNHCGQFLISSHPCAKFQQPEDNLASPLTELFLPISSDVAVISYGEPAQVTIFSIAKDMVNKVNRGIASQSTEIAGASKELVEKYAEEMKARVKLQK